MEIIGYKMSVGTNSFWLRSFVLISNLIWFKWVQ